MTDATRDSIKIVRASIEQLAEAQLLLSEYYEAIGVVKQDTPEEVAIYFSDAASGFWIACVEETPAGCVALRPLPTAGLLAAECKRLYVRPHYRKQGLAEALLNTMETHAATASWEWIYLDSKDDLTDALRLYIKRGYQSCERYNNNPQATIFLRKDLRYALGS